MYWHLGNQRIKVSHKVSALTLSLTEDNLVSYDLAGRFLGSYAHGTNIRRGLDNSFQQRWRVGQSKATHPRHRLMPMREAKAHLENCRIQIFHPDGGFIAAFGQPGAAPGNFDRPSGLAIDEDGLVCVCDTFNSRVQVFASPFATALEPKLRVRAVLTGADLPGGALRLPNKCAFAPDGTLYVSDTGNNRVVTFPAQTFSGTSSGP